MEQGSYFEDPDFQDELIKFLIYDRNFLRDYGSMLEPDDFLPRNRMESRERYWVAKEAIEFWRLYRDPMGKLLRSQMLQFIETVNDQKQKARLDMYIERLSQNGTLKAASAIGNKIVQFKREKAKASAVDKLMSLQQEGKLTDDAWIQTCQEGLKYYKNSVRTSDYWDELEKRIARRGIQYRRQRFPFLLIDPLDQLVHIISRGHIGLVMAPWKRGKSLFLQWTTFAYILQGLRGSYWTLEDPLDDVEDRFDACVTNLPIKSLHESEEKIRQRFAWVRKSIRTKLKIYDGTDGGVSIRKIEDQFERDRNMGFTPDFVIVDYDDELVPPDKKKEKHERMADVYAEYRSFVGRHQLIGWTASQTGRDTQTVKIISGGKIADAIGKVRKAHLVLGLGAGDWGDDSCYLYVDSHRSDRSKVGCNIMMKKEESVFYDRDATMAKLVKFQEDEV